MAIKDQQAVLPLEGARSLEGLDPSSAEIDSYDYLTRSLTELQYLVKSSLGDKASSTTKLPKRLPYPTDWLPYQLKEQQELNEEFLKDIEQSLGIQ
ncbi:hypothetical protein SLS60_008864 [Paraconiothyrium brasiliense]|uniref:Uncharacterized protein n=1 Tax=Paraconiothyrium brasiliense TaxID=300254 RepID=A0ABR3QYN4_9PLEO